MDKKFIFELIEAIDRSSLTSLEISDPDGTMIKLKKEIAYAASQSAAVPVTFAALQTTNSSAETKSYVSGNIVTSPIVGTVYLAPAPDAAPFVSVGDEVAAGSVLCIVEAMKMMNEIESEFSGKVAEILVENGALVEYGQPLMRIV